MTAIQDWAHNPNIQKMTHKAMYGPEGNSDGKAAFMSAQEMKTLLKGSGVPLQGKPFELFYYLIKDVFMGKDEKAEEQNINKFAKQLEKLTGDFNEWESIKSELYASANGTDTSKQFNIKVATFLNTLLSKMGFHFPTTGAPLNEIDFGSAISAIKALTPYGLSQDFPVLGESAVSLLNNLIPLSDYFTYNPNNGRKPKSLPSLWKSVQSGGPAMPEGGNMPNPQGFADIQNGLTEGSSYLSGISSSNGSKLQYAQNEYNRLNSFVHNMLSAWLNIRKEINAKMAQARN